MKIVSKGRTLFFQTRPRHSNTCLLATRSQRSSILDSSEISDCPLRDQGILKIGFDARLVATEVVVARVRLEYY